MKTTQAPLKVMLFIPCYNVESAIVPLLKKLESVMDDFYQIIIVDNNSTDNSRPLLLEYVSALSHPKVRLFFNERNYLLGGSTIVAFREAIKANADFLVCMHGDGQAKVEDLKAFFPLELKEDFVVGSRLMANSRVESYSFLRLVANHFFAFLQKCIIKQDVRDLGAFIAFNIHTIKKIPYERIEANMAYHPSLIIYVYTHLENICTREFPIHWGKVQGSHVNVISYGILHLWRLIKFATGRYKLTDQKSEDYISQEVSVAKK